LDKKTGFDNERYLKEQSSMILERVKKFDGKLYLEFGGKIMFDYHASRVLPGYDPNVKMLLLEKLKDKAEIILCIYSGDIEKRRIRGDFGITYDADALRMLDDFSEWGMTVRGIVLTRFENQPSVSIFKNKLERRGVKVYTHRYTKGYPTDVNLIVSEDGYGSNSFIETEKPIVVVTGPGPGSGKLATCLSQLYHEHKRGINAGYAKFETFPIWNLPLRHPVNIAYEAATVDIKDFNMIDSFHLEAYNKPSVNYNRDMEIFPVLRRILQKITHTDDFYKSPTDMGVNCAALGITDNDVVCSAARQEIIRRYFRCACEYVMGISNHDDVQRVELLMKELLLTPEDRNVVKFAKSAAKEAGKRKKGNKGVLSGAAIELNDGTVVTGYNSTTMHAVSCLVINAIKKLSGIPDKKDLISEQVINSIASLKNNILDTKKLSLNLEETLIALGISATYDPDVQAAVQKLVELRGCEVHTTHIPASGDEAGLRMLGVNMTSEPAFATKSFYTV
jgi:uncharacterized protein (UPF0371 family)